MTIISAKEAREQTVAAETIRRYSDTAKMNTIMKGVKNRIQNGFYYYDYQASVSYAMAKTLIDNGYQLKSSTHKTVLSLEDFKDKPYYQVRIAWEEQTND